MTFPEAIQDAMPPDDNVRISTVLSRFPTTIDVQGEAVPVGCLASYTPIVGDTVFVMRQDSTWCITGRTTDPASGLSPQMQAGVASLTVAAATSGTQAIVFATPFRAIPAVSTNIDNGAGATAGWGSRAINITTTGFTIFIFGTVSSFTASVYWQAQELTQ
jgi:H-type lectin domain